MSDAKDNSKTELDLLEEDDEFEEFPKDSASCLSSFAFLSQVLVIFLFFEFSLRFFDCSLSCISMVHSFILLFIYLPAWPEGEEDQQDRNLWEDNWEGDAQDDGSIFFFVFFFGSFDDRE
jgi:Na+/H+ antiporter NhaD/arsenite permease-like protein